jgi:hypothetical protein
MAGFDKFDTAAAEFMKVDTLRVARLRGCLSSSSALSAWQKEYGPIFSRATDAYLSARTTLRAQRSRLQASTDHLWASCRAIHNALEISSNSGGAIPVDAVARLSRLQVTLALAKRELETARAAHLLTSEALEALEHANDYAARSHTGKRVVAGTIAAAAAGVAGAAALAAATLATGGIALAVAGVAATGAAVAGKKVKDGDAKFEATAAACGVAWRLLNGEAMVASPAPVAVAAPASAGADKAATAAAASSVAASALSAAGASHESNRLTRNLEAFVEGLEALKSVALGAWRVQENAEAGMFSTTNTVAGGEPAATNKEALARVLEASRVAESAATNLRVTVSEWVTRVEMAGHSEHHLDCDTSTLDALGIARSSG